MDALYQKIKEIWAAFSATFSKKVTRQDIKEWLAVLVTSLLVVLIICILLFNRIVVFVEPGQAAVLYRLFFGGTVTTKVYGEGIQFIWPWDTMYVYNVRVQECPHEFSVLAKNGLKIKLKISVRYRPEYSLLGLLHQQVGPNYVNIVVIPEIEHVLRVLIGQLDDEQLYTTKKSMVEKAISGAVELIAQRYIAVDNVIVKEVELPESVNKSISRKLQEKHIAEAYEFKLKKEAQEKERKKIEAEGLERFQSALTPEVLHYMGIQATLQLAKSKNSKVVVVGSKDSGFPIIGNMPLDVTGNNKTSSSTSSSSINIQAGRQ